MQDTMDEIQSAVKGISNLHDRVEDLEDAAHNLANQDHVAARNVESLDRGLRKLIADRFAELETKIVVSNDKLDRIQEQIATLVERAPDPGYEGDNDGEDVPATYPVKPKAHPPKGPQIVPNTLATRKQITVSNCADYRILELT